MLKSGVWYYGSAFWANTAMTVKQKVGGQDTSLGDIGQVSQKKWVLAASEFSFGA